MSTIITVENLSKTYGIKVLFNAVNFGIEEGDKIGLIGVNGTGKSTFLKVLAGIDQPDGGKIMQSGGCRLEYLPQEPVFTLGATVLEQVFKGGSPEMQVLRAYEQALEECRLHPGDQAVQNRMIQLGQQMDALDVWKMESDAKIVLTKLGVAEFSALVESLSGGQRKRVALAAALITPSDLLILDEPTNHIDNDTVAWLEQYLAKRKGALLMITHDRYFLDRVANKMIELDKGRLYTYSGNYSQFLELKAAREESAEASEAKRQNLLRKELAWMRRGAKARTTKQKARIQRFEALSEEQVDLGTAKVEISVGATRLGRTVIELEHISYGYDERKLIDDFSYILLKDDRVGIIGPNGSGKSTLLNIIAGRIKPDCGCLETGQTVKLGYFAQENVDMDENLRVIEYIREEAHHLPTADGGSISASQMLERFLFPPELQWNPIAKLSGGEKRRLYLLRVLMGAPNVLLLDEPTNDLDIQTLAILEEYLDEFPGAVITVSHDRYFLDRVVDKVFAFEGDGEIRPYNGGYSDYQELCNLRESKEEAAKSKGEAEEKAVRNRERPRKLSYNEQKEYESIDAVIAEAEGALQALKNSIANAGSDYSLLQELTVQQEEMEKRLDQLLERWSYLTELVEASEAD